MKKSTRYLVFALALGSLGTLLAWKAREVRARTANWRRHQRIDRTALACPECHGPLELVEEGLRCEHCARTYPIVEGIPHFIEQAQMSGWNRTLSRMYDWFSWIYPAFSKAAFAVIGMPEEAGRREITDRLDPGGGRVLEVSIGPGVNLPYLARRADVGQVYGLDISLGQLRRCQGYAAQKNYPVQLQLGNAEQLPYPDETFAGVFHIGGINFFNDKGKAIREMIRVAKPDARILLCDETEKGARAFELVLPGFKRTLAGREEVRPPVDLVPAEMQELRLFDVWKGWMYCIEFRKP